MTAVLGVLGGALLLLAFGDAIATAVRVGRRGGPVTRLVAGLLWRVLSRVRRPSVGHVPLYVPGLVVTLGILVFWLTAVVIGWFLIFSSSAGALHVEETGQPAGGWDRLNFAAASVFGRAMDLRPSNAAWDACAWAASASGLILLSLAIAYLIPITAAVSEKRQLARVISALGRTPAEIVAKGWRDGDFRQLENWLMSLTPMIARLAEHHLAYPMLHFFHTADRDAALGPSVAVLNDALLLLDVGTDDRARPSRLAIDAPRAAIDALLSTMPQAYVTTAVEAPTEPDLDDLDVHDIPHEPRSVIQAGFASAADQRRRILSLVHHEGWAWAATTTGSPDREGDTEAR